MRRLLPLLMFVAALVAAPAIADPEIDVQYRDGFLRVTLDGSYAGTYYEVWRSGEIVGLYRPLATQTLCTGDCFLTDQEARPGKTYYYRFDLQNPSGERVSFGPYAVTVPDTPLRASLSPNPSRGAVRVELSLPGSRRLDPALQADARVLDLQGRTVRLLHSGALVRGVTSLTWDGHRDDGQRLGAGVYFLRLATPIGSSTTRVVRFR